jgi:hypothetical protein
VNLVSLDIQGWRELDAAFARAPDIVREELLAAVTEADRLLEREVVDRMPTATGLSRASVFSREEALPGGGLGVVGTAEPHVVYVELGTRPHFPPVEALEDWVRVKLAVPERRVHGVAFAIARKIAQRGTLGVGMFHRAFAANRGQVERFFAAALGRIAVRIAGGAA